MRETVKTQLWVVSTVIFGWKRENVAKVGTNSSRLKTVIFQSKYNESQMKMVLNQWDLASNYSLSSPVGYNLAWSWLNSNWPLLLKTWKKGHIIYLLQIIYLVLYMLIYYIGINKKLLSFFSEIMILLFLSLRY